MTGPEIRDFRKSCGVNQTDFANALGVSRRSLVYWESGEFPVSNAVARLLACMRAMGWARYLETVGND